MIWYENLIYIFLTKTNGVWCIEEIEIIDKEIVTNSDFIIPKSLQIFVVNLRIFQTMKSFGSTNFSVKYQRFARLHHHVPKIIEFFLNITDANTLQCKYNEINVFCFYSEPNMKWFKQILKINISQKLLNGMYDILKTIFYLQQTFNLSTLLLKKIFWLILELKQPGPINGKIIEFYETYNFYWIFPVKHLRSLWRAKYMIRSSFVTHEPLNRVASIFEKILFGVIFL